MTFLTLPEIKGLTTEQLVIRKPVVVRSLKRQLEIFRATDAAVELIDEWSRLEGIRNAIAYELQETLAKEIERPRCSVCRWVTLPGQSCCDDRDMDFTNPPDADDYPDDATIEDWDRAFGSLVNPNLDDSHLESDTEEYVMTSI